MFNSTGKVILSTSSRHAASAETNIRRRSQPDFRMMVISHTLQFDGDSTAVLPSLRYAQTVDWRIILSALALTLLMASHGLAALEPATVVHLSDETANSRNSTPAQPVAKFAQAEINRYEEVISAATEKAENEADPQRVDRYAKQLKKLTHEMDLAKKAELQWKKEAKSKREPFAREHLKESIEALQESGTRLLDEMIAADRQDGLINGKPVSDQPASDQHLGQE